MILQHYNLGNITYYDVLANFNQIAKLKEYELKILIEKIYINKNKQLFF